MGGAAELLSRTAPTSVTPVRPAPGAVLQGRFLQPEGRGAYVLAVLSVTIVTRLLGQLGIAVTNRLQQPDADVRPLVQRALAIGTLLGLAGIGAAVGWGAATGELEVDVALAASLALVPNVWSGRRSQAS